MATPPKAPYTTTTTSHDLELGDHGITPSASSSFTPHDSPSKPATPTLRHSLDIASPPLHEPTPQWRTTINRKTPVPVARFARKVATWVKGPQPPRRHTIAPLWERWQTFPTRMLGRLPKWLRVADYAIACVLWVVIFGVVVSSYGFPSDIGGWGAPVRLACVNNLW